jgi:hypothetical protein
VNVIAFDLEIAAIPEPGALISPTDHLDCTCDAAEWCSHRKAAADEIAAVDARMNRQDALDYARGQY